MRRLSLVTLFVLLLPVMPSHGAPPHLPPGIDGEFVKIGEQVPGFAGFHFDAEGDLVVHLVDMAQEANARSVVDAAAASRPLKAGKPWPRAAAIKVQKANYSFAHLAEWRSRFATAISLPEVEAMDIDETQNRVRIEVSTEATRQAIVALAADLSVPADAYLVEVVRPGQLLNQPATLLDPVSPVVGGFEIASSNSSPGFSATCTLGINVWYSNIFAGVPTGTAGFLTASHCSAIMGQTDGTNFTQGGVHIGTERYDPPFFTSLQDPACEGGRTCRWSDATFVEYAAGTSWSLGKLAQTEYRSVR